MNIQPSDATAASSIQQTLVQMAKCGANIAQALTVTTSIAALWMATFGTYSVNLMESCTPAEQWGSHCEGSWKAFLVLNTTVLAFVGIYLHSSVLAPIFGSFHPSETIPRLMMMGCVGFGLSVVQGVVAGMVSTTFSAQDFAWACGKLTLYSIPVTVCTVAITRLLHWKFPIH